MSFVKKIKRGKATYLAEVENKRIKGKVVQTYIRYIGKEVNGKATVSISSENLQFNSVKIYGPLLVLHRIAEKAGLPNILGEKANEILSMVYAHCINYKSINHMPKWFERTDLNVLLNLENLTEGRLLSALDTLDEQTIESYQRQIFRNLKKVYKISSKGLVYDVTNTYLYGTKCQIAKLGKSKEAKGSRPLIQIGLATTQKEGLPVFHKTFEGNIHDSRTLSSFVHSFSGSKIRSGLLVYDRGIVSRNNLLSAKEMGWNTLCGLPVKGAEKDFIRRHLSRDEIVNFSSRVRLGKNIFYVKSFNYEWGGIFGKLVVCYNDQRRRDIRESRYDEVVNAQRLVQKNKPIKRGLEKYFTTSGQIRRQELERAEEFDGYTCLFSTKSLLSEDMLRIYFEKDVVERAFKTLKGVTQLRPIRHWLYNRVRAHVFICYLSYLLLSILRMNLRKFDFSVEETLNQLDSLYKIYYFDRKKKKDIFSKTVLLSKNQETLIKAIDKSLLKKL